MYAKTTKNRKKKKGIKVNTVEYVYLELKVKQKFGDLRFSVW
jgi:hypothetical protein